jgi:uncharacterized Ntn-hydrolase superfamily protein
VLERDRLDAPPIAVVEESMSISPRSFASATVCLSLCVFALPARATWSVVAVDPETREVGVAVATCVPEPNGSQILPQVAGLAPGLGALAAQAQFNQQTRDQALGLLRGGEAAQALLDEVVTTDRSAASRQYGVVTLARGQAAYTGSGASAWAGAAQAPNVSVQGNILVSRAVVDDALAAFAGAGACTDTLADRLLRALEAGARAGGDSRCPPAQGALVAVLRVAAPSEDGDAPALDLLVKAPRGGDSPLLLLRRAYESYRQSHPRVARSCPSAAGDGGTTTFDGGASARDASALTPSATLDAAISKVADAAARDGARSAHDASRRDSESERFPSDEPDEEGSGATGSDAREERDQPARVRPARRASGCSLQRAEAGPSALLIAPPLLLLLRRRRRLAR